MALGGSGSVLSALEQLQCIAVPADPSDPLLREWVKVPENPIAAHPPGVGEQDFRDPSTAWQQSNGTWVFTIGAKTEDAGISLLYTSTDLKKWELEEKLLHSGPHFGMWECVDFFKVDHDVPTGSDPQKYVFKISHFDEKRDYYTIGTYDEDAHKFTPDHEGLDVGLGHKFDYGKYYAAKSFFDPVKNRRINWAWVAESCTQEMDIENGWSSIMVRCPSPHCILWSCSTSDSANVGWVRFEGFLSNILSFTLAGSTKDSHTGQQDRRPPHPVAN